MERVSNDLWDNVELLYSQEFDFVEEFVEYYEVEDLEIGLCVEESVFFFIEVKLYV